MRQTTLERILRLPSLPFRDPEQRLAVCRALAAVAGEGLDWRERGPSALRVQRAPRPFDGSVRETASRLTLVLWSRYEAPNERLSLSELLRGSPEALRLVAHLLLAMADGPEGLERWLADHEVPGDGAPGFPPAAED